MKGAIFFSGQYGSTHQYATWVSEATGLPMHDVNNAVADPSKYDFLVLGSSVIVYKLTIGNWVKQHLAAIQSKPIILFTVSGASAGPKLNSWVTDSLPQTLTAKMQHIALGGRMDPKKVSWWVRLILKFGAWRNDDPEAKKQELLGFDFMDKSKIEPINKLIQQFQSGEAAASQEIPAA